MSSKALFKPDLLSNRTRNKSRQQSEPVAFSSLNIIHVDIWFDGGQTAEMNLTSPGFAWGDFVDLQYVYLREYFKKVGPLMKLEAYQASICYAGKDGQLKVLSKYEKVDFSLVKPFAPGQYWECQSQKGGQGHE